VKRVRDGTLMRKDPRATEMVMFRWVEEEAVEERDRRNN
jgi:hypothetical protein